MKKEEIESQTCENTVVLEPRELFDTAIVDIKNNRIVYGFEEMIEAFMEYEQCSYGDAIEFIEYNTCRAIPYMGEYKPIIRYEDGSESEDETETD